jgi:hypothetical protein
MKRVDALHPRPFVAAQASALWFSLTHCLVAALSGALTILPALLAVLSTADISLRLLLVSLLLAASRPKRSWPGGSAGASRMCDSCSRRCSRRCSTRAASTCESGRIVKLKGLVYVAAFGLLLGLLGELQRRCFTITAAGTTTTVGRRSSHSGRVHHILLPRVIGVVASGIEALGPEKPSPTRQRRAEPP